MFCSIITAKAQYTQTPAMSLYDTNLMRMAIENQRIAHERIMRIMDEVEPYREAFYQKYREGKYKEAINICLDVRKAYVKYVIDNQAIRDMESVAGDCAVKIRDYELAIFLYKKAKEAKEEGIDSKLNNLFYIILEEARNSYKSGNYSSLWDNVSIALQTGWENGECYYYYGKCYEQSYDIRNAKKMYKLAKKKDYPPAAEALNNLKNQK